MECTRCQNKNKWIGQANMFYVAAAAVHVIFATYERDARTFAARAVSGLE